MRTKCNPLTALYIVFVLTFSLVIDLSVVHVAITLITATYVASQGIPKRALRGFLIYILLFSFSLMVYRTGINYFRNFQFLMLIAIRVSPLTISIKVVNSFSPRKISSALSKIHFPKSLTLAFLISVRFLPTLKEEFRQIVDAMHLRRLSFRSGYGFLHPFQTLRNVLVPLLFRCLQISEELGYAAMSRGVDAPFQRSETEIIKFQAIDFALAILFTITVVSGFIIKSHILEIGFAN